MLSQQKVVDAYFEAWRSYDAALLRQLFTADAVYVINACKKYSNIEEIQHYWKRNRARQRDLRVSYVIIDVKKDFTSVHFLANFYNAIDRTNDKIDGEIHFYCMLSKIYRLSEWYVKDQIRAD